MPEGEQYVVVPSGVVHGGEVQRDRGERTYVFYTSGLDADIGNDRSLVVIIQRSSTTRLTKDVVEGERAAGP
jgi:hypothetical protein